MKRLHGQPHIEENNSAHRVQTEKLAYTEGSKEARIMSRSLDVLRLLQRTEAFLKSIPKPNEEETRLKNDISKSLDYIEFGA